MGGDTKQRSWHLRFGEFRGGESGEEICTHLDR